MKLKIRIKEVKEKKRPMTVFEEALFRIVADENKTFYYDEFILRCKNKLNEIGLSTNERDGGYGKPLIGTFRTETIRDATPEEIIAWHCTQIWKPCDMIEGKCVANCPKKGVCEVVLDYKKSMAILEGKDVILEVI